MDLRQPRRPRRHLSHAQIIDHPGTISTPTAKSALTRRTNVKISAAVVLDGFLEEHRDIVVSSKFGTGEWFVARQIFDVVLADPRTHAVGLTALAEAFVTSYSFDNTRAMWGLIESEGHWESEQLRRLEYAVQTNRQVYEAVVGPEGAPVPDLVKALVEQFEPPPLPDHWATTSESPW